MPAAPAPAAPAAPAVDPAPAVVDPAAAVAERPAAPVVERPAGPAEVELRPLPPPNIAVLMWTARQLKRVTAWDERPASLSERFEYSLSGDWANSDSRAKRNAHLVATLGLLPFAMFGASIVWATTDKPSRGWLIVVYMAIVIFFLWI